MNCTAVSSGNFRDETINTNMVCFLERGLSEQTVGYTLLRGCFVRDPDIRR